MKKVMVILLAVSMFAVVGCARKGAPDSGADVKAASARQSKQAVKSAGKNAERTSATTTSTATKANSTHK
jgi:Ni/Co efflux regulator RcnB